MHRKLLLHLSIWKSFECYLLIIFLLLQTTDRKHTKKKIQQSLKDYINTINNSIYLFVETLRKYKLTSFNIRRKEIRNTNSGSNN